jgi:hypothetical protein
LEGVKLKIQCLSKRLWLWGRTTVLEILVIDYAIICMKLCCINVDVMNFVNDTIVRIREFPNTDVASDLDDLLINIMYIACPRYRYPKLGMYQTMDTGHDGSNSDLINMAYTITNTSFQESDWHERITRFIHTIAHVLRGGRAGYKQFNFWDYKDLHIETIGVMKKGNHQAIRKCLHTILVNMLAVYYCQEYLRVQLSG